MNVLEAGMSRVDITPILGIGISGYYVPRFADGVLDPLEANALAVRCGDERLILISVDNCGVGATAAYDSCRARVAAATGVPVKSVFISCILSVSSWPGPEKKVCQIFRLLPRW